MSDWLLTIKVCLKNWSVKNLWRKVKMKRLKWKGFPGETDAVELCSIFQWDISVNSAVKFTSTRWDVPIKLISSRKIQSSELQKNFREITPAMRGEKVLAVTAPRRDHTAYHGKKLRRHTWEGCSAERDFKLFAGIISPLGEYVALDLSLIHIWRCRRS